MSTALAGLLIMAMFFAGMALMFRADLAGHVMVGDSAKEKIALAGAQARTQLTISSAAGDRNRGRVTVSADNTGATSVADFSKLDVIVQYDGGVRPPQRFTYTTANPPPAGQWTYTSISGQFGPGIWDPGETIVIEIGLVGGSCDPGTITIGAVKGVISTNPLTCPGFFWYFHSENSLINGSNYHQLKTTSGDGAAVTITSTVTGGEVGRFRPASNNGKFVIPLTGIAAIPAATWTIGYRAKRSEADLGFVWLTTASDVSLTTTGSWRDISLAGSVPEGASGAIVEVVNTSTTTTFSGVVRGKDDTWDYMSNAAFEAMAPETHRWQIVELKDGTRKIQGWIQDEAVDFKLLGYTVGADPSYFTTPPNITPVSSGAWTTVDLSALVDADAAGVILSVDSINSAASQFGVREVGSGTSTTHLLDAYGNTMYLVGLNDAKHFEAYVGSSKATGTHDGAINVATLDDSTASFITAGVSVGDTVKNMTDGSAGVVTGRTATTITASLGGGTDNDWDTGDTYLIPSGVNLFLVGQTKKSVVYYGLDIPVADPTPGSWQELDADAYGIPTVAKGLVLYAHNSNAAANDRISFRHGASSDDWAGDLVSQNHFQAAIGLGDDNVWDQWMESTQTDVSIAAYTRLVRMDVHAEIDILVRQADGALRDTIDTNAGESVNLTGTAWQDLTGTISFPGYTVVDQTDYLEIDLFASVTTNLSGEKVLVDFRIDDPFLDQTQQIRVTEGVASDPAPAAPTNLAATPGDAQVFLDWDDNAEPDLAGYNVYRALVTGGPYTRINGDLVTASAYTDTSLINGATYYYVVTAVDDASNESLFSNEANVTPSLGFLWFLHSETKIINGTTYYKLQDNVPSDGAATTISSVFGPDQTGRVRPGSNNGKFVFPLTGLASLDASTWAATYRVKGQFNSWWNTSWQSRRKITFDNSASTQNLVGFPVLVSLTSANVDYAKTQDLGEDIRFVDTDGSTLLSHEIEKWDETGTSTVWVKVPQIDTASTTDFIWMYYNNTSASDGQNTTAVWDTNYKAVWHLDEPSGTTLTDSTVNANAAAKVSATEPSPLAAGQIDGAQSFDGTNDYADAGNSASLDLGTGDFTLESWVNTGSGTSSPVIGKTGNPAPTVTSVSPAVGVAAGGTSVTITGTGFANGATVTFDVTAATGVTVVNATTITATTPAHTPAIVDVVVTNLDTQSATLSGGYTYFNPTIQAFVDPDGDISGGWSPTPAGDHYATIDDAIRDPSVPNDADYLRGNSANNPEIFTFNTYLDVSSLSEVIVHVRWRHDTGGADKLLDVTLRWDGADQQTIRSGPSGAAFAWETFSFTDLSLNQIQFDSLEIKLDAIKIGGGGTTFWEISAVYGDITYTQSIPNNQAFIDPNGDAAGNWIPTPAGAHFATVDDAIRDPSAPNDADYLEAIDSSNPESLSFPSFTNISAVRQIDVHVRWKHSVGSPDRVLEVTLRWDGADQVTIQSGASSTSFVWETFSFTGLSVGQAQMDGLEVKLNAFKLTGGGSTTWTVAAVYGDATYNTVAPSGPPTVTSVSPSSGSSGGGTSVTITGANFADGATVTFDGTAATTVTWVNSTTITATTPAHAAGAVDVAVTNPDAQIGALAGGYLYLAAGEGFIDPDGDISGGWTPTPSGDSYATVDDGVRDPSTPDDADYLRGTQSNNPEILAFSTFLDVSSASEVIVHVRWRHDTGGATEVLDVTLRWDGVDQQTIRSGPSGAAFAWETFSFTGLSLTQVQFDSLEVKLLAVETGGGGTTHWEISAVYAETTYTVSVPNNQGFIDPNGDAAANWTPTPAGANYTTVDEAVRDPSTPDDADYLEGLPATNAEILSFTSFTEISAIRQIDVHVRWKHSVASPDRVLDVTLRWDGDDQVTIQSGPSSASFVWETFSFTGLSLSQAQMDGLEIKFDTIKLTGGGATTWTVAAIYGDVTYNTIGSPPAPTVTSVSPSSGPAAGGTSVTITGTDFVDGATVTFDVTAATGVTWVNSTTITATTPVHVAGYVDVVVTNPDAQSGTLVGGYAYGTLPTVTSVSPANGPEAGGTSVTITGTGFVDGATVTFDAANATGVTFNSSTSLTVNTPAHAVGPVDVTVTNPDTLKGVLTGGFTYDPLSTLTGYSMGVNADGTLYFETQEGGALNKLDGTVTVNNSAWRYVVVVRQGTAKRIYVDGVLDVSGSEASAIDVANTKKLCIGCGDNAAIATAFFNGSADEVRISNFARSADWIAAQHRSMVLTFNTFGSEGTVDQVPGGMTVHVDIDVLVRQSNGTVRSTLATNVANSANITGAGWQTLTATYVFPGYTVVDDTDHLEIDLFAEATANTAGESVSVDFRIDDPTLGVADQTKVQGP